MSNFVGQKKRVPHFDQPKRAKKTKDGGRRGGPYAENSFMMNEDCNAGEPECWEACPIQPPRAAPLSATLF